MNLISAWPRMMSPELAQEYVGGRKLFEDLIGKKKLLKPRAQGNCFTRYDRREIDAALDAWRGFGE